jgi:V8-like Glu-specific endopeptidase
MQAWKRLLAAAAALGLLVGSPLHGKEPQTRVTTLEPVHANVCHLEMERSRGAPRTGSAVLFESRYLLTAGHNLMQDWTKIRSIKVRCGVMDAEGAPVLREVQGWQTLTAGKFDWWRLYPKQQDFGVIRLSDTIQTGSPIRLAQAVPGRGEQVCLFGYPGEHLGGYTLYQGCAAVLGPAFFDSGIEYYLTTYRSNSGGPVLRKAADGSWELVAIHIQPSSGRQVDDSYRDEIRRLMRKLDQLAIERAP